ncbi:Mov34/MPN/PAD-1 family protein [Castellaniella sp.]|uniref:Mov34/MPN/PAD-1 family protein n=1 Tax=Castellaniella sp. TaxID=1955812 RepID=UPI002AFE5079|nr:Mov34/MPN/PAD-1 family protein [Castellaniella sp.]
MSEALLQYQVARARWKLDIPEHVALFLSQHSQRAWNAKESVGQLYSRNLTTDTIVIDEATLLRPAWSRRARVQFAPSAAMAERKKMFSMGLHCVGLWHSHPESVPSPSHEDLELATDYAVAAKRQLRGIVFAILGTAPFPAGLAIWVHDGIKLYEASPLEPVKHWHNSQSLTLPSHS